MTVHCQRATRGLRRSGWTMRLDCFDVFERIGPFVVDSQRVGPERTQPGLEEGGSGDATPAATAAGRPCG